MSSYLLKNYIFKVGSWEGGQEGGEGAQLWVTYSGPNLKSKQNKLTKTSQNI